MADHDRIEHDLEDRILDSTIPYDTVETCIEYQVKRKHGECDVLAVHGKYAVIVEIKGRDKPKNRTKARHQLEKDVKWVNLKYPDVTRIFSFYSYTDKSDKKYRMQWYSDIR